MTNVKASKLHQGKDTYPAHHPSINNQSHTLNNIHMLSTI